MKPSDRLVDPEFGPVGVIVIGQDITDQVEAARLKDEFISTVSHELRTPDRDQRRAGLLRGGVMGDLGGEINSFSPSARTTPTGC